MANDSLEGSDELAFFLLHDSILGANEVRQQVENLLNISEGGLGDLVKLSVDLLHIALEGLDLLEDFFALRPAVVDEGVSARNPRVFPDTRQYLSIQATQVLLEQRNLLILDRVLDVVVVANDEHHILSEDAQLLLASQKLANLRWNSG